ncbi:pantetheine-phosphate adenylyltransferase [Corynebacterium aquilae]|uniref:Phosphopantetheine adenylyltransferase n=1 Tax=Corynebacterium aquilae DSM 44791 TaxID=1431546 RepID=A0A1L7CFN7_9CORY|nr:pantetheine-phosphate adenylyltransferase [Corynebacterium aquilae]APT84648.1 phosphopantetheine adenylyltransferase [Corynebacterium aquilae DSM 44791]
MRVVCPGSFDPVTMGHLDVFERAARQFEHVIVLVTHNPNKQGMFTIEQRLELITQATSHLNNVSCDSWSGLLVDYTTKHDITALVKGLRSGLDYEYELPMAQMNHRMTGLDTFFLLTDPKYGYISSTLCKEVARYGGDVSGILPPVVVDAIHQKLADNPNA